VHVTQEVAIGPDVAARYWRLYDEAFAPLRLVSPHRQNLFEDEFHEEMNDERIIKFVLWDGDEAVGMALVATDVSAVPWVSAEYFAHRYPAHFADGRIYYFGALLMAPEHQRDGSLQRLTAELVNFVLSNDGMVAFDCAGMNQRVVPRFTRAALEQQAAKLEGEELDAQHYHAFMPSGFRPGFGPGRPFGVEAAAAR
jgi:GNAT superfamily N-acetyltransferase